MSTETTKKAVTTKSSKGTKGTVGAPLKDIKWPRGKFTIADVVVLNKDTCCELTVRHRVKNCLAGKAEPKLVKLDKVDKKGTVGCPAKFYMSEAQYNSSKKFIERANKETVKVTIVKPTASEDVPNVDTSPAPVEMETPVLA